MEPTEIADALRGIAEQIEDDAENGGVTFENTWGWNWEHTVISDNSAHSWYGIGVDSDGDVIIEHNGYVKTVDHDHLREALELSEQITNE